jgi:hypothetical protein
MALQVEGVVDRGMETEEALRGSGRLDPHFSDEAGFLGAFGPVL